MLKTIPILILIFYAFAATAFAQTKPSFSKIKDAKIRLIYKGKSAVADLENLNGVTLGGERWHQYKIFFATIKNGKIYFLFRERGGSPMGNPMGACGGDSPQTLIWLKTDLSLKLEEAKSEVFASCAYNGGRYQQGETRTFSGKLKIVFEQQRESYEITYDNKMPESAFDVKKF